MTMCRQFATGKNDSRPDNIIDNMFGVRLWLLTISADSTLEASRLSFMGGGAGDGCDDDRRSDSGSRVWRHHFRHYNTHTRLV